MLEHANGPTPDQVRDVQRHLQGKGSFTSLAFSSLLETVRIKDKKRSFQEAVTALISYLELEPAEESFFKESFELRIQRLKYLALERRRRSTFRPTDASQTSNGHIEERFQSIEELQTSLALEFARYAQSLFNLNQISQIIDNKEIAEPEKMSNIEEQWRKVKLSEKEQTHENPAFRWLKHAYNVGSLLATCFYDTESNPESLKEAVIQQRDRLKAARESVNPEIKDIINSLVQRQLNQKTN